MIWKGPFEDRITQSLIGRFLQCPFRFYLYAGLGYDPFLELNDNLVWGDTFHKALELSLRMPKQICELTEEELGRLEAEVGSYLATKYPTYPRTFVTSIMYMLRLYDDSFKEEGPVVTEKVFDFEYNIPGEGTVTFSGKVDGLVNSTLVEHKCKGKINPDQTSDEIPVDVQVNLYAKAMEANEVIYDLIRIPDTQWSLPQKREFQKPDNYIKELYTKRKWGDFPVYDNKNRWYSQIRMPLNKEEIENCFQRTIIPVVKKMIRWYEHVTSPGFDIDNSECYNDVFYITPIRQFDPSRTEYYKSDFHDYMVGNTYLEGYPRVKSMFNELEEET
ncbi:MAG: hypothetical protein KatS3mg087_1401 [Patescibacteria group bacterium]|nr:MAG: hypothetical protein KatS3mg087_1401 [Patescibacteria group bacterium]